MKVLFVHSGNFKYGIESFIKSQGESLIAKGIELDYYPVIGKGLKGYYSNIKKIKKISNNYNIIHAHYGLIGLLCVLALTKKPIVLSIMGSDIYGSYNVKGKRIRKSYPIMLLTQIALIFSKRIIAKSNNILKYIPYKDKTEVIANGVNFSVFRPMDMSLCRKELGIVLQKKVILYLGNPDDPRKNYELVKQAVKGIKNDNFLLINPYPIKHRDFVKYLNASNIFILSSYNEGSPNVIKEAMACNIPIISTDVGDVKELINETKGCYIVDFSVNDMRQKVQFTLSNEGKRTTGRKDIIHLDSIVVAQNIINIYNSIV